jgi:hypothetical protein
MYQISICHLLKVVLSYNANQIPQTIQVLIT